MVAILSGAISVPVARIEISLNRVTLSEIGDEGGNRDTWLCLSEVPLGRPDRGTLNIPIWTEEEEILSNGKMPDIARSCSRTGSVRRDDDGRRHILVSKRKVQALDDKW